MEEAAEERDQDVEERGRTRTRCRQRWPWRRPRIQEIERHGRRSTRGLRRESENSSRSRYGKLTRPKREPSVRPKQASDGPGEALKLTPQAINGFNEAPSTEPLLLGRLSDQKENAVLYGSYVHTSINGRNVLALVDSGNLWRSAISEDFALRLGIGTDEIRSLDTKSISTAKEGAQLHLGRVSKSSATILWSKWKIVQIQTHRNKRTHHVSQH